MLKIGIDIGGVLSKYPEVFKELCRALSGHIELHVITDIHDKDLVLKMLQDNGFDFFKPENVHVSDYVKYGEMCKAVILKEYKIDILIDDFGGYTMWDSQLGDAPIRLLVQPNAFLPYWSPNWKTDPKDGEFGRRISPKELP